MSRYNDRPLAGGHVAPAALCPTQPVPAAVAPPPSFFALPRSVAPPLPDADVAELRHLQTRHVQ